MARPAATLVFTTPAADGLTALRLVRQAASQHGLHLPDPHAELGSTNHVIDRLTPLGLTVEKVDRRTFPEPLGTDPRATFDTLLFAYGFAGQLAAAPPHLIEAVFANYRTAHIDVHSYGTAEQTIMLPAPYFTNLKKNLTPRPAPIPATTS